MSLYESDRQTMNAHNRTKPKAMASPQPAPPVWELRLYVAGKTPRSAAAISNLQAMCKDHLAGAYHLEVIDLVENPKLSQGDKILATPTLVKLLPAPVRRIIGDLSQTDRVLVGLDLRSRD